MAESFAQLFEESLSHKQMRPGAVIRGKVVQIGRDYIIINAGLKSEGVIPVEQFYNEGGELEVNLGDEVDVALEALRRWLWRNPLIP